MILKSVCSVRRYENQEREKSCFHEFIMACLGAFQSGPRYRITAPPSYVLCCINSTTILHCPRRHQDVRSPQTSSRPRGLYCCSWFVRTRRGSWWVTRGASNSTSLELDVKECESGRGGHGSQNLNLTHKLLRG